MQWKTDQNKLGAVVVDVVVQLNDLQYIAGSFVRSAAGNIVFCSSDGAWTIEVNQIKRYVVLE